MNQGSMPTACGKEYFRLAKINDTAGTPMSVGELKLSHLFF